MSSARCRPPPPAGGTPGVPERGAPAGVPLPEGVEAFPVDVDVAGDASPGGTTVPWGPGAPGTPGVACGSPPGRTPSFPGPSGVPFGRPGLGVFAVRLTGAPSPPRRSPFGSSVVLAALRVGVVVFGEFVEVGVVRLAAFLFDVVVPDGGGPPLGPFGPRSPASVVFADWRDAELSVLDPAVKVGPPPNGVVSSWLDVRSLSCSGSSD